DFGFTDPRDNPANVFLAVKITTLPTSGTLNLGSSAVAAGATIPALSLSSLVYTAPTTGTSATFTFQVQDNGGTANGGVDLDPSANSMTVTVTGVNDAPVGTANSVTTN